MVGVLHGELQGITSSTQFQILFTSIKIRWSSIPGVVIGSSFGVLAAKDPDVVPDFETILLLFVSVSAAAM